MPVVMRQLVIIAQTRFGVGAHPTNATTNEPHPMQVYSPRRRANVCVAGPFMVRAT